METLLRGSAGVQALTLSHPVSEYTPELITKPTTQVISADKQRKGGGINR
jgi:hypothetical protein